MSLVTPNITLEINKFLKKEHGSKWQVRASWNLFMLINTAFLFTPLTVNHTAI
jgi:hypothetical protein